MREVEEIITRMLQVSGEKNEYNLSKKLGFSSGAFSTWKKRGNIPMRNLALFSQMFKCNIDYLLYGEGEVNTNKKAEESIDPFFRHIDKRLTDLEKQNPEIRSWVKFELKKKYPEIVEGKKQAVTAETSAKTGQVHEEKPEVKNDNDFNIRQQIADIKDALTVMGIKTGIFKEKKKAEINADVTIEQQVSGIRDTLNAVCIKMGLLEERRKEQKPINFPDRRHSEHNR